MHQVRRLNWYCIFTKGRCDYWHDIQYCFGCVVRHVPIFANRDVVVPNTSSPDILKPVFRPDIATSMMRSLQLYLTRQCQSKRNTEARTRRSLLHSRKGLSCKGSSRSIHAMSRLPLLSKTVYAAGLLGLYWFRPHLPFGFGVAGSNFREYVGFHAQRK